MNDQRLYRVLVWIAIGLFCNLALGLIHLLHGTPAYADAPKQPSLTHVLLCDQEGIPLTTEPENNDPTDSKKKSGAHLVTGVFVRDKFLMPVMVYSRTSPGAGATPVSPVNPLAVKVH